MEIIYIYIVKEKTEQHIYIWAPNQSICSSTCIPKQWHNEFVILAVNGWVNPLESLPFHFSLLRVLQFH